MNITIIGSGNAATVLGKLLLEKNHIINQVAGRNATAVKSLALILNANACNNFQHINNQSELYVIAVRDEAVKTISEQLNLNDKIVVHTCGSVSINALKNASNNYGVLYPLQSLRKELSYAPEIPFLVDGNNEYSKQTIFDLASSIASQVIFADDITRLKYHLAAITSSNFSNHLFALADDYCTANNLSFSLLLPLIEETLHRLCNYKAADMQTGPAARGDELIIQKHIELLENFPQLQKVYKLMSESIMESKK